MGLAMRFHRKIANVERGSAFSDRAERQLFWKTSIASLRHQALSLQAFGLMAWMLSRLLAHPGAVFDPWLTGAGVAGAICGMAMTYTARSIVMTMTGGGL
ncbi:hypothetical protein [Dyella sp. EPa41]|uniref:hypothetical protein n=1 Tax=Dyella sp. EPa41 TaxID=1561194 RepID=UPI001914DC12|nr:hypothetical protein [Dyella sp. EPa41]